MKYFKIILFLLFFCTNNCLSQTYIRKGPSNYGTIIYNFDKKTNFVRQGHSNFNKIIYYIDGKYIKKGSSKNGNIIFNVENKF